MNPSRDDDEASCPCLVPAGIRRPEAHPAAFYCRHANGRVQLPTRDQLVWLCAAGRYLDCPGYRRWAASEASAGALASR